MTRRWIVRGPTRHGWYLVYDQLADVVDNMHPTRRAAQKECDHLHALTGEGLVAA